MPKYPGAPNALVSVPSNQSPIALQKGESCYVFGVLKTGATQLPVNDGNVVGETLTAPQASIAVNLQSQVSDTGAAVGIEGFFSGAPGAFNVQVQVAETDADGFYLTSATAAYTITALGNSTAQTFRVDLSPSGGKFMRILLSSLANVVTFACKITRAA